MSLVDAFVYRLGRVHFSCGRAGALGVLRGTGTAGTPLRVGFAGGALKAEGNSVVMRGGLSATADTERRPRSESEMLGRGGGLPTSLRREANIWAAASKLCCGTRTLAIVEEARCRVGDVGVGDVGVGDSVGNGGTEDTEDTENFVP